MGAIQPWHLVLLLIVVLIVLGPGKLPEVGKGIGEAMREFRRATGEFPQATHVDTRTRMQPAAEAQPKATTATSPAPQPGGIEAPAVPPAANTLSGGAQPNTLQEERCDGAPRS